MNLKNLSDRKILNDTKDLVTQEKKLTANIIDHLQVIERRKLYCDLKYKSLFDYAVGELSYSEDQAYRRLSAMRLSRKVPAVKEKIDSGEMSLTNANLLSGFFKDVPLPPKEEKLLVEKISNTTKAECQNILADLKSEKGIAPRPKKPKINHEGSQSVRLHLSLPKFTMEKITELKGLFAHRQLELAEIVDLMADALLEKKKAKMLGIKLHGSRKGQRKQSLAKQSQAKQTQAKQTQAKQTQAKQTQAKQTQAKQSQAKQTQAKQSQAKQSQAKQSQAKQTQAKQTQAKQTQAKQSQAKQSQAKQSQAKQTQAKQTQDKKDREQKILPQKPVTTVKKSNEGIPARELFNEQTNNATNLQSKADLTGDPQKNPYKNSRTIPIEVRRGALARADFKCENCSSTFALQFEHRIPVALGGRSTAENTLLLCRNCNFREGVKIFGVAGMGAR